MIQLIQVVFKAATLGVVALVLSMAFAMPSLGQASVPTPPGTSSPGSPTPGSSSGTETFDVKPGQLQREDMLRQAPPSAARARQPRNQKDAETLVADMASAYRSACCPHQKMADRNCPCYPQQIGMLTFLALKGYSREEIDSFMVYGGPGGGSKGGEDLTREYEEWLMTVWIPAHREPTSGNLEMYFDTKFLVRGKPATYGWNHGWTELIRETPKEFRVYLLLMGALVLVVGAFVAAFVILKRMKVQELQPDGRVVEQRTATDAERAKLNAEVAALEED